MFEYLVIPQNASAPPTVFETKNVSSAAECAQECHANVLCQSAGYRAPVCFLIVESGPECVGNNSAVSEYEGDEFILVHCFSCKGQEISAVTGEPGGTKRYF